MTIEKYFEIRAEQKRVEERLMVLRQEIVEELHVSFEETKNYPEYVKLSEEEFRLHQEADSLTGFVIRANIKRFGIDDVVVRGLLNDKDGHILSLSEEMLLSDLCCLQHNGGLVEKLGIKHKGVEQPLVIKKKGRHIGTVDRDGSFNFFAAPGLRDALGWKIATDGGRERVVETVDINSISYDIVWSILGKGFGEEVFFGPYIDVLSRVFVCENTSRFGDGFLRAATVLWRVTTRLIGREHPGYLF